MSNILNILNKPVLGIMLFCFMQGHLFAQAQEKNTRLLPKLLKKEKIFDSILKNPGMYDIQIIYTQINRKKNRINFIDYHYNVDKNKYFYPSSTVFLPAAALALEKINDLSKEYDINRDRYVKIDNALTQEIIIYHDASSENNYVSFSNFIKNMFVSGDRRSYNSCYDFLNQRYYNERMHSLGFGNSWFLNKFNHAGGDSRQSNNVTFFRTDIKGYYIDIIYLKRHPTTIPFYSIYVKKGEYNPDDYYSNRAKILLGKGFVRDGAVVDSAMDFSAHDKFTVEDMHGFMKMLAFPGEHKNRLRLSEDDCAFLFRQMMVNDSSFNYIMNDRLNDPSIRIFNNPGKDMGFMIDNAYILDTKNGVDFLLTVALKCNRADIFGEEYYEYEKTGLYFMKNISSLIYEYEINRKKSDARPAGFLDTIK
ncbi:MAG: serine hydrolase [Prevotellaceae bacterium]|jgi:hypothetical protein|nr:serine hydrolase [Prevotellaceae bacterium]